jgi:hypothetical protein
MLVLDEVQSFDSFVVERLATAASFCAHWKVCCNKFPEYFNVTMNEKSLNQIF